MNTIQTLNTLLSHAISSHATDIHCLPFESQVDIKLRIFGQLQSFCHEPHEAYARLINRLKTLCQLDVAQSHRPQDGQFLFFHQGQGVPMRFHSCPSLHGEKCVIRILKTPDQHLTLEQLGMPAYVYQSVQQMMHAKHGLVLTCGPTGSGKTTTLYAILDALRNDPVSIVTLEDPIEIPLHGISQLPVREAQQLSYAQLLKAVLRQDPDIIMIGEIRDSETAQLAVRAALTGHLVLTTVHAPTTQAALTRLTNMGVPGFDLQSALIGIIAQRLHPHEEAGVVTGLRATFEVQTSWP